jgi:uncharacterized membrane protein YeaQ/YmgE (transglycosylase-associated protein family)
MTFEMIMMSILVGLLTGVLAGFGMKRGGYGLRWDIPLGLVGSIVMGWIFHALGVSPGAGVVAAVVVALVGAAIPIVAQRKIWPTIA